MLKRLIPLLLCALPLQAQELNLSASPQVGTGSAAQLALAQAAYVRALRDGEVMLLLSAIRLARGVTLRPATGWVRLDEGAKPETPAAFPDPASEAAMAIARNLAGEAPDLQDLVYDLDAQRPGTQSLTAVEVRSIAGPGETDSWSLPLFGEVAAEIALVGTGDGPLALAMTDETGATVCAHPAGTEAALCRVTPARNGFFTVTIHNPGAQPVGYRLIGN